MERSREIICKITSGSRRVVAAANNYARRKDCNSVSRYHFQLEQDMRRISVACECLANLLEKPLPEGPTVDVRIKDWVCTAEPQECLDILGRMENLLQKDTSSWVPWIFQRGRGSTAMQDKIKEAVDLFDSCKGCFHILFSTEIWNNEMAMQKQQDAAPSELRDHITQVKSEVVEPRCCAPVQGVLNTLAEHVARDDPEANVSGLEETVSNPDIHARTQKGHRTRSDQQREEEEKQLEDILKWLDGLNCAEKQDVTLTFRQEGTCKWLFETTEYKMWRDGESGFLWLRGKSGAGKSVLVSFVIDSFRKDGRQREGETLTFFYCDFRNERSTSSAEVMRSILSQLLRQLRGHSADPGSVLDDLIKAREWGGGTIGNAKELAGFASRTVTLLGHKPVVIVDALDECRDVRKLIQALMVIKDHVRLFVASRPLNVIVDELSDLSFISMGDMADKLSGDIELHITRELDARQRLRDLDPEFKVEIRSVLCKKADGMFRWVQCSIDTLDRCMTRKEARAVLYGLPKGLDEIYERILRAIDMETPAGQLAQRALIWLVAALRPLRLCEIMEALSINLETRTLDRDIAPMHNGALLDACGSLITYSREMGVMNLAHSSVKEYLTAELTRAKLPMYHISEERAHLLLVRSCLCYISICLKRAQGPMPADVSSSSGMAPQPRIQLHPKSHPLLDYALDDALDHFGYLGSMFKLALHDVTMLAEDIEQHSWVWDHVCIPGRWDVYNVSTKLQWPAARHDLLLYILVAFASNSFVCALFRGTAPKPKKGTNPLVYAAYFNKDEHARTLLRLGAGLNERGWETIGFLQSLPIEVAFRNRHYTMVTLFAEEGSTVPPNIFRDSFFHPYAQPLPSSIARLLLQTDDFAENINKCLKETALNALTSDQLLVLNDVTEQDFMEIIKRFAQVTDEGFPPDSIKESFFRFSVAQGYFTAAQYLLTLGTTLPSDLLVKLRHYPGRWKTATMIRFLLDNGADVLAYTSSRDSALHAVLWAPSYRYYSDGDADEDDILEAIKLLVDLGCNPMQVDSHGNNPFRSAVEQGHISVARYLLTLGALIPSDLLVTLNCDQSRWVAASMIRFLVENGADVLAHTVAGDSLLHIVLQSLSDDERALEVVKVLIDYGCNPLKSNSCGKTPVHIAVEHGLVSVARHLLAIGAHLPPDLLDTLSRLKFRWTTAPMIQFLVENHVNVLTRKSDGDTLLHTVLKNPHVYGEVLDGVVKLLVSHGCDPLEADSSGKHPLHIAAENDHISVTKYLLRVSPRPLPPDIVTSQVGIRPCMIRLLVENGVSVLAHSNSWADSVLHTAVRSLYDDDEALDAVRLLVGYGCDPTETNGRGDTLLHAAVKAGHISVARYLLILGIRFPPDLLVASNHLTSFETWHMCRYLPFLIENGVDVLARTSGGESVLHIVLRSLYLHNDDASEAVKVLVDRGCDPFEADACGNTPFHIAVQHGNVSAARYLVSLGAPVSSNLLGILKHPTFWSQNFTPMIHFLVENGVNIHAHTGDGDSLLHVVLRSSHGDNEIMEVVKVLVDHGCDPFGVDACGNTPFYIAVQHGNIPAARYLVSLGAPVTPDLLATLEHTMFWLAPMIHFLVENGVNVHAHTGNGDSLLHVVLRSSDDDDKILEVVKVLVDHGCDPFELDACGNTPFHIAVQHGHISAARHLVSLGTPVPPDLLVTLKNSIFLSRNFAPMIHFLVENGVNVRAHTSDGDSFLHVVLRSSYDDDETLEVVTALVDMYGCDPFEVNDHGNTPFHIAIQHGNTPAARYLVSLGVPVSPDLLVTLKNPIFLSRDLAPMIHFLVKNGVNVHAHTGDGDSLLHVVLRSSHGDNEIMEVVKVLVDHGCDPFGVDACGNTPLHIAVQHGNISAARYLVSLGTPVPPDLLVTLKDPRFWSRDFAPMIHFLVENGVNIHAHTGDGDSLLHVVLQSLHDNDETLVEVVKALIDMYGCDPCEVDDYGNTPFHIAVQHGNISAARYLVSLGVPVSPDLLVTMKRPIFWLRVSVPMIHFLVKTGVNVHARTGDGDSMLHIALRSSYNGNETLEVVKVLVDTYGCDPLEPNYHGYTPLHVAIEQGAVSAARYLLAISAPLPSDLLVSLNRGGSQWGSVHMIHLLVENGVDLLAHANDGGSVLQIALQCWNDDDDILEAVKFLVARGCDPMEANYHGHTALYTAIKQDHISAARYLLSLGASLPSDLLVTLNRGRWSSAPTIRFLVENGVKVHARASNGDSVLHIALQCWNSDDDILDTVKLLVGHGCDPLETNYHGHTPLHVAVERGNVPAARYLLTLGALLSSDLLVTLNRVMSRWSTAPMIKFLAENGADLLAHANNGDSVLHIALLCSNGDDDVLDTVKLLVSHGCDPLEANYHGYTPLHIAVERGKVSAARYLLSLGASLSSDLLVTLDRDESQWSSAPMIRLLVENRVNVLAHASDGDSVLHTALRCSNNEDDALATVKLLVGRGCNSSEVNDHGHTPLHIAVERGKFSAARYLLSIGAHLPSDLFGTLNCDQPRWSSAAMMHFLVENGVNVLEHANNGDSMLHVALRCWNDDEDVLDTVKFLVARGCDPLEPDNHGRSPIHIAIAQGDVAAARYLASHGALLHPDLLLTLSCDRPRWSTAPMIHFLVEKGVNLLVHASDGDSVLHIVLRCFNDDEDVLEVAKLLVGRGCGPLEVNSRGETPLHIAAARGYVSVAGYLIAQGANVLTKTSNRDSALHFATGTVQPYPFDKDGDGRALRAVKFFVRCGSEPTVPNDDGKTPLHLAVDLGRIKTVKYLISLNISLPDDILFTAIQSDKNSVYHRYIVEALVASGSDAQKPNSEGDTPLQVAIKNGRTDVVEYLLSVASVQNPPLEDLLSAVALAPPSVQGEMKRMLSDRRTRSESPELPPAKRVRVRK